MKAYFFLVLVLFGMALHSVLHYNKNENIEQHIKNITDERDREYNVVYNNSKILSDMIFKTLMNTTDVIDIFASKQRTKLHDYLNSNYEILKTFNIRQLHFHLPNNDSFLRMHRPNKFGDNLTKARLTVKYVNENKKFIDGFEEGKIFNGFRFVYPMFKDSVHIGSVEISHSALFFIREMVEKYNLKTNFFISKKIVGAKVFNNELSNYIQSPYSKYFVEKSILNYLNLDVSKVTIDKLFQEKVYNGLKLKKAFSLQFDDEKKYIVTYIPLVNPITTKVVGFISIQNQDNYIQKKDKQYIILFSLSMIVIAIGLLLIYRQVQYQFRLKSEVNKKTKELKEDIVKIKKLELEKLEQQEKLLKQEKMASLGEMIGNIAHQWRQPLSVISTGVTGMQMQKEYGMLKDEDFNKICEAINSNAQYLSKTIDDFTNFIKGDSKIVNFNLKSDTNSFLKLVESTIKNYHIDVVLDLQEHVNIQGYPNELKQCFINIFNNSKDALIEKNEEGNRLIFISQKIVDKTVVVTFKDNAGGIPEDIIGKIFEPYFTTKHKSKGTGLGLTMAYNLIVKGMNGTIEASNITYNYNGNDCKGAMFILVLPVNR